MCVCVRVLCALQVRDQLTPEIMAEIEEGFGAETYILLAPFCTQDRLGTNIGNVHKKGRFS